MSTVSSLALNSATIPWPVSLCFELNIVPPFLIDRLTGSPPPVPVLVSRRVKRIDGGRLFQVAHSPCLPVASRCHSAPSGWHSECQRGGLRRPFGRYSAGVRRRRGRGDTLPAVETDSRSRRECQRRFLS